jgi:formiminotetrahydrofolate cyclodeaminase
MLTKLTLTVDKEIIERAKIYARKTGRSLSEIIQIYLDFISQDAGSEKPSSKLKKIMGAVKLPKNFDEEKEIRSHLEKKHL